jgi:hypothetical protein
MDIQRPTLVVGVGGTGCEAAERVYADAERVGLVERRMLAVIGLDTSERDYERLALRQTNKVLISSGRRVFELLRRNPEVERDWFYPSDTLTTDLLNMQLINGAGQVRMLSRLALHDSFRHDGLEHRLRAPLLQLTAVANQAAFKGQINVLMIGSLAGGTGCGSFLQTALALREIAEVGKIANLVVRGLFLLPDVFVNGAGMTKDQIVNVCANGAAALRELNAITQATVGNLNIESINCEFMPGRFLKQGQTPFEVITLIDFEMRNGQTLGSSLASYKELLYRAAFTQLFLPLGQEIDDRSVNSVQQKLSGVTLNSPNSYASVGIFSIVYPEAAILEHLTTRFASGLLEGDWLVLDRKYRQRLDLYDLRRRSGDGSVRPPHRGESYIEDLQALARERRPLMIDIQRNVFFEEVDANGTRVERQSHIDFLDAFEEHIVGAMQHATDGIRDVYAAPFLSDDQLGERADLPAQVRKREAQLDRFLDVIRDAARDQPDNIYENLWVDGLALTPSEWQTHHIQKLLIANAPHLVEVRYLAYLITREIDIRLKDLRPEDSLNSVMSAAAQFEDKNKAQQGRRAGQGVHSKASSVADEGNFRAFTGLGSQFSTFTKRYSKYYRDSLEQLRTFADVSTKRRCLERLRGDVIELQKLLEALFADLEVLQGTYNKDVETDRAAHGPTRGAHQGYLYVYADSRAKDQLWKQLETQAVGANIGREANSRLVKALFEELRRRRRSSTGDAAAPPKGVRALFETEVVNGYCRRRLVEDLGGIYKIGVTEAIRREAGLNGAPFEQHFEQLVRIASQQAEPFIQVSDVLGGNTAPTMAATQGDTAPGATSMIPALVYWAMNPETRAAISDPRLFDALFRYRNEVSADERPQYSRNELMCVHVLYNFPILALAKLQAGDVNSRSVYKGEVGRYERHYREKITALVQDDRRNAGKKRSVLTPHLDRSWHNASVLPEIFETGAQESVYRAFVIAYALAYARLETEAGQPIVAFYDPSRLAAGGARREILKGHDLSRLLAAFHAHPELVLTTLEGFETTKTHLMSDALGGRSEAIHIWQQVCHEDTFAALAGVARNASAEKGIEDLILTLNAYKRVVDEVTRIVQPGLVEARAQQNVAAILTDVSQKGLRIVEDNKVLNADVFARVRQLVPGVLAVNGV